MCGESVSGVGSMAVQFPLSAQHGRVRPQPCPSYLGAVETMHVGYPPISV